MLLRIGIAMMTVAVGFAAVTAIITQQDKPIERTTAAIRVADTSIEPLVRNYPPEVSQSASQHDGDPQPTPQRPEPPPTPERKAEPRSKQVPTMASRDDPQVRAEMEQRSLPSEQGGWQPPTEGELEALDEPRYYTLSQGAIMGLTVDAIGIYNAPVLGTDGPQALAQGVVHVPETSLPWDEDAQKNVYLAGHRMGYRGTWSRLIFYRLNKVTKGDLIVLKDRRGKEYDYRVRETFLAEPSDSWVMGEVHGRDMLTLQTCTPIPTFEKRLIVRADRV